MLPADVAQRTHLVHVCFLELSGPWDVVLLADDVQTHLMDREGEMRQLQVLNRAAFLSKPQSRKILEAAQSLVRLYLCNGVIEPHDVVIILCVFEFVLERGKIPLSGGLDVVVETLESGEVG